MKDKFYVDDEPKFDDFIKQVRNCKIIAVDTEFYWRDTFKPQLCLIQVALSKEICYLIDPIAIKNITRFGEILTAESIVKIFHDPIHDLKILTHSCKISNPKNIFDTRRAAGFAGFKHTLSLADLTKELLDVQLPKTETQTDWTKRPLTAEQINYAVNDVIYLFEIYDKIVEKCDSNGLIEWMRSEMNLYENGNTYGESSLNERLPKMKGIKRLSLKQLIQTKYLVDWRDNEARIKNIPKTFVLRDKNILKIVRTAPDTIQDLMKMNVLNKKIVKEYGNRILSILKQSVTHDSDLTAIHKKLRLRISGNNLKTIKQFVAEKAKEYNIPAELIASRADLVTLLEDIKTGKLNENLLMKTWRREIFSKYLK